MSRGSLGTTMFHITKGHTHWALGLSCPHAHFQQGWPEGNSWAQPVPLPHSRRGQAPGGNVLAAESARESPGPKSLSPAGTASSMH